MISNRNISLHTFYYLASNQTQTTGYYEGTESMTITQTCIIAIVGVLCSIITVIGNFLVILSFFVNPTLRYFSNFIILSLAISDFIIGE